MRRVIDDQIRSVASLNSQSNEFGSIGLPQNRYHGARCENWWLTLRSSGGLDRPIGSRGKFQKHQSISYATT